MRIESLVENAGLIEGVISLSLYGFYLINEAFNYMFNRQVLNNCS